MRRVCWLHASAWAGSYRMTPDADWSICDCEWESNWWLGLASVLSPMKSPDFARDLLTSGSRIQRGFLGFAGSEHCAGFGDFGATVIGKEPATALDARELFNLVQQAQIHAQIKDLLYEMCLPGRMAWHIACAHRHLAREQLSQTAAHVRALQVYADLVDWTCLRGSVWPFDQAALDAFVAKWGKVPVPVVRAEMLMPTLRPAPAPAALRPCAPMRAECFPAPAPGALGSCVHCCDPRRGVGGWHACFDEVYSFARCCGQEFSTLEAIAAAGIRVANRPQVHRKLECNDVKDWWECGGITWEGHYGPPVR